MLDDLLARRIARTHSWLRTGGCIREHAFQPTRACYRTIDGEGGTFYSFTRLDPTTELPFRSRVDEDSVRATEISPPELASLARTVITEEMESEAANYAMARKLGL